MNCTDKFLKHSERVGARFAEHNAGKSSCTRDPSDRRVIRDDCRKRELMKHSSRYIQDEADKVEQMGGK